MNDLSTRPKLKKSGAGDQRMKAEIRREVSKRRGREQVACGIKQISESDDNSCIE